MTRRNFGLIHPQPLRIERAARDSTAWLPEPGAIWRQQAQLSEPVETAGITQLPWSARIAIWALFVTLAWLGIATALRWWFT